LSTIPVIKKPISEGKFIRLAIRPLRKATDSQTPSVKTSSIFIFYFSKLKK
jgi:hypothetical protein